MKVQILGGGCAACESLAANTAAAIEIAGVEATVEKITDMDTIVEMGAMITPAIAIDGAVKRAGRTLSVEEIAAILAGA